MSPAPRPSWPLLRPAVAAGRWPGRRSGVAVGPPPARLGRRWVGCRLSPEHRKRRDTRLPPGRLAPPRWVHHRTFCTTLVRNCPATKNYCPAAGILHSGVLAASARPSWATAEDLIGRAPDRPGSAARCCRNFRHPLSCATLCAQHPVLCPAAGLSGPLAVAWGRLWVDQCALRCRRRAASPALASPAFSPGGRIDSRAHSVRHRGTSPRQAHCCLTFGRRFARHCATAAALIHGQTDPWKYSRTWLSADFHHRRAQGAVPHSTGAAWGGPLTAKLRLEAAIHAPPLP